MAYTITHLDIRSQDKGQYTVWNAAIVFVQIRLKT